MFPPAQAAAAFDPRQPFSRAEAGAAGLTAEMLLVLAGLPEPRVNLIFRGRDGGWRRRYDLAYEELRLIIEYDGRQHADDAQQWQTDIFRREELDHIRWRLVLVTSEGIYREPLRTLERVRDALLDLWGPSGSAELSSQSGGCTSPSASARRLETANVGELRPIRAREPS